MRAWPWGFAGDLSSKKHNRAMGVIRGIALLSLAAPALLVPGCGAAVESAPEQAEHLRNAEGALSTNYVTEPTVSMGTLQGKFAVDEKGGATYAIPLTVPPGAAGVEPSLSLVYSSHQRNGMLGMRVSLAGLGTVTRCPQTKAQDGIHGSVKGDANDRFCLDGQRLVLVYGTYGADGSEYRTEIDNGSRIHARGTCGLGPCRFEVADKHGNLATYGGDVSDGLNAFELLNGDTHASWSMTRLESPNGAYYTVRYVRDGGQTYPDEILYTMHDSLPGLLERRVKLTYESRGDVEIRYLAGKRFEMQKRLSRIETSIDTPGSPPVKRVAREYRLAYLTSAASGRSLLDSVRECDEAGVCLPPTRLQWENRASETFHVVQPTTDPRYQTELSGNRGNLILGDFNGDGKTDFIHQRKGTWASDTANNVTVYLSLGNGEFQIVDPTSTTGYKVFTQDSQGKYVTVDATGAELRGWLDGNSANIIAGDFNGDGKTDFIRQRTSGSDVTSGSFNLYLSKGNGYFDVYTPTRPVDYALLLPDGSSVAQTPNGSELQGWLSADYGSRIITGDFNGDGKTDFIRQPIDGTGNASNSGIGVYLSKGDGRFDLYRPQGQELVEWMNGSAGCYLITGDFDGDGRTDFIRQEHDTWDNNTDSTFAVYFSEGNGRFRPVFPPGEEYQDDLRFDPGAYIIPGDFNGDGKTDFFRHEHGNWAKNDYRTFRVYLSRGDGTFDISEPEGLTYQEDSVSADHQLVLPLDWNGDGRMDFLAQPRMPQDDPFRVFLSRGDGTFDMVTPPGPRFQTDLQYDPGTYLLFGDFDGDGKADFLRQEHANWADDTNNTFDVYFGKGLSQAGPAANPSIAAADAPVDQAITIVNGLGGKVQIGYQLLRAVLDPGAPMRGELGGMFVVGSYAVDDGQSGPLQHTFSYGAPVIDPDERGFAAFASYTEQIPSTGAKTISTFETTYPKSGMLIKTERSGGGVTKTDTRTYVDLASYPGVHRIRVDTEESEISRDGGGPPLKTSKKHAYDAYGNRQITHVTAAADDATQNHDECIDYAVDVPHWRIDYPTAKWVGQSCSISVYGCGCGTALEGTNWYYDAKGNVTTSARMLAPGAFLFTTFTYDELGNVLTKTDPTGVKTTFTFDESYRTYPEAETRRAPPPNDTSTFETWTFDYEPRLGKRIYSRDPNGHERWVSIDGVGREVGVKELDPNSVPKLVSQTILKPEIGARYRRVFDDWTETRFRETREYLDGFERVYREEKVDGAYAVVVERSFDAEGRVRRDTNPHWTSDLAPITRTFTFDALGAAVAASVGFNGCPEGQACSRSTAAITHEALGNPNVLYTHIATTESVGTSEQRVSHEWRDARDRVVQRRDPDGRVTKLGYDILDRKVRADDGTSPVTIMYNGVGKIWQTSSADRGTVTHTYSGTTGLLMETNDSGGQKITYTYDILGRLATKTVVGKATTTYRYDEGPSGKGRLTGAEVKRAGAQQPESTYAFAYDGSGRVITESVTVAGETYTIRRTYAPSGLPLTVRFPDQTTLASTYTTGGLLETLQLDGVEYARWAGRTAENQPLQVAYKNGTTTWNSYDNLGRLTASKTNSYLAPSNGATLLDYTYAWDEAQRITAVTDNRDPSRTQSFTYSAGGSLIRATGIYGQIDYAYDLQSNLTSKVETPRGAAAADVTDYGYSGHRVISANAQQFAYNAGGDRVSSVRASGTTSYVYDGEHRLSEVREAAPPAVAAPPGVWPQNLALNKPTSQSSTYNNDGISSHAVDGNTSGLWGNWSVTHTQNDPQAWWQVDLGSAQAVGDVVIYNRTDCCSNRLSNFNLLVSTDNINWQSYPYPGTAPQQVTFHVSRAARYVKVQLVGTGYLSLAEVQVFAAPQNLALGKPTSQSSEGWGGASTRAVDGNTSGLWGNWSVTHTNNDPQAWWQVDLGSAQAVGDVVIYNRTDCCSDRLSNFNLLVSSDNVTWQSYPYPGTAPAQLTFHVNRAARYVKVQLVGTGYMALAEVQVFSPAATPPAPAGTGSGADLLVSQFAYDFEGERVLKVDWDGSRTLYISKEYEVLIKPDGTHLATKYLHGPAGRVAAVTSAITAPTSSLDIAPRGDGPRTAVGVIGRAGRRLGAFAPVALALGTLALAFTLSRLRITRARVARAAARLRALVLPPATAWARRHPIYATVVPLVITTFLSACVPPSPEHTGRTEDPLTAGANGAGNPIVGEFFFHPNHIGSTSLVTDAGGIEVARAEYKPYGELVNDSVASPGLDIFRAKFTGKEWDKDANLYYYGARHYDPATGRFLTADSYLHGGREVDATSLNPYAYTGNNPVTYIDPSGHFAAAILAIIGLGALVGAYLGGQAVNGTWDITKWSASWRTFVGVFAGALVGGATSLMGAQPGIGWAMGSALLSSATTEGLRFLSPDGSSTGEFFSGVAGALIFARLKTSGLGFTGSTSALWYASKKAGEKLALRLATDFLRSQGMVLQSAQRADGHGADEAGHGKQSGDEGQKARETTRKERDLSRDRASNAMLVVE